MENKIVCGVGSRNTPPDVLELMMKIMRKLNSLGYTLRSGGAKGADTAFECCAEKKEIFYANDATDKAMDIAKQFHPAWGYCQNWAKRLHGRNAFQVLGRDLKTPASFVICWTPCASITHAERTRRTGGTGTAISIANHNGIPVYNLARDDHRVRLEKFVAA